MGAPLSGAELRSRFKSGLIKVPMQSGQEVALRMPRNAMPMALSSLPKLSHPVLREEIRAQIVQKLTTRDLHPDLADKILEAYQKHVATKNSDPGIEKFTDFHVKQFQLKAVKQSADQVIPPLSPTAKEYIESALGADPDFKNMNRDAIKQAVDKMAPLASALESHNTGKRSDKQVDPKYLPLLVHVCYQTDFPENPSLDSKIAIALAIPGIRDHQDIPPFSQNFITTNHQDPQNVELLHDMISDRIAYTLKQQAWQQKLNFSVQEVEGLLATNDHIAPHGTTSTAHAQSKNHKPINTVYTHSAEGVQDLQELLNTHLGDIKANLGQWNDRERILPLPTPPMGHAPRTRSGVESRFGGPVQRVTWHQVSLTLGVSDIGIVLKHFSPKK